MIVPRDYQTHADDALWDYLHSGKKGNPLVLMPTGTGKSVNIGMFCRRALWEYPTTRILKLTTAETLIGQNEEKLLALWPQAPLGVYSAGLERREAHRQITFAGIQSIYKLGDTFPVPDIVVIDEADLIGPRDESMYQAFFTALLKRNPKIVFIGFTATDWRTGMGKLTHGNLFTDVAIDMTTPESWKWFVDNHYLSRLSTKKTSLRLDESGIGKTHGEYILSQQEKAFNREEITEKAIHEMSALAFDRQCWMIFGTGVKHCDDVAGMLNEFGIDAIAIHSKSKEPEKLLKAYKNGEYRAAVSMNKLTTGVDVPQIDFIGGLRMTDSSRLWVQLLGRGARPLYAAGYDLSILEGRAAAMAASCKPNGCLVADFAHNAERLGTIDQPVIPEPPPPGKKKKSSQGCPVRVCPNCAEYVHASKRYCPCGYEFVIALKIQAHASTTEVMFGQEVKQEDPIVERIDVEQVTYRAFKRRNSDKPPTLRVTYYARGLLRRFEEYICFEHDGGALTRARNWWVERSAEPVPQTCADAEAHGHKLRPPKSIKVWTNLPKPKVMSYEF